MKPDSINGMMRRVFRVPSVSVGLACLSIGILLSVSLFQPEARSDDRCFKKFDLKGCPEQTLRILFDAKPPEITAPPDIKVVAEEVPVFVEIGKPKVDDFVDAIPLVTNNAPAHSMFQFGTTVVEWKTTDLRGNSAVAYQFVTVVKHPSPPLPFNPATEPAKNRAALEIKTIPSYVPGGQKVLIAGKLIDANKGDGVQGVNVKILDNRPLDKRMLGEARTDDNGNFNFIWYASPTERGNDRSMSIIAKFDGTPTYGNTVSHDRSLKVQVDRITLDLIYKKQNFGSGDRVIVLAAFKTFGDKTIDPDEMKATFDGREVTMIRQTTGIYEYMSLANAKPAHLFTVKAIKLPDGELPFGSVVGSVTIR